MSSAICFNLDQSKKLSSGNRSSSQNTHQPAAKHTPNMPFISKFYFLNQHMAMNGLSIKKITKDLNNNNNNNNNNNYKIVSFTK